MIKEMATTPMVVTAAVVEAPWAPRLAAVIVITAGTVASAAHRACGGRDPKASPAMTTSPDTASNPTIKPRVRALSLAAAVAGMIPLGALQLSFNKAVSGSPLHTPFSWYNDKYLPGTSYGAESRDHERMRQIEHTAHFHHSYQQFTRPFVEMIGTNSLPDLLHERLRMTTVAGSTHGMTLIFAPFALLLLLPRRGLVVAGSKPDDTPRHLGGWHAWLLAAPFPLMVLLYLPYGFYLYQYAGTAIPTLAFWLVAGGWALASFQSEPAAMSRAALPRAQQWLRIIAMPLAASSLRRESTIA